MTAAFGPGRPLPGGRHEGQGDGERETRRLASRLAAAQRRLGQPSPATPAALAIVEDLPEATPAADSTTRRAVIRRITGFRRPRRGRA